MIGVLVAGCARTSQPCACDGGHGVRIRGDGPCQCLSYAPPTVDPVPAVTVYVDADATRGDGTAAAPWPKVDWKALDELVATGDVLVTFDAGDVWSERLDVLRTDQGPHRVVLHGRHQRRTRDGWVDAGHTRATVPGVSTGFADVPRSRITVRGFDVTGSRDKGVYWRAGDDVVVEDNVVHDNRGSPSISLDYTSRSGHASTSFAVRNNHVFDQHGECIYIGGAEGRDRDSHERVVVEGNLVHDCRSGLSSQDDGINIKDRLGHVTVAHNVVFATKWGIEIASPGEVVENLVFESRSNGLHVTDGWGRGLSGLVVLDLVVIDPGEAGLYLNATNHPWTDVTFAGVTVVGARQAAFEAGGDGGITGTVDDIVLAESKVGLDAWSPMAFVFGACVVHGNDAVGDRLLEAEARACTRDDPRFGDLSVPAGPDGWFFTDDDPWVSEVGGARPR